MSEETQSAPDSTNYYKIVEDYHEPAIAVQDVFSKPVGARFGLDFFRRINSPQNNAATERQRGGTGENSVKPVMIGGKHFNSQYEAVCECSDATDVKLICEALNA